MSHKNICEWRSESRLKIHKDTGNGGNWYNILGVVYWCETMGTCVTGFFNILISFWCVLIARSRSNSFRAWRGNYIFAIGSMNFIKLEWRVFFFLFFFVNSVPEKPGGKMMTTIMIFSRNIQSHRYKNKQVQRQRCRYIRSTQIHMNVS